MTMTFPPSEDFQIEVNSASCCASGAHIQAMRASKLFEGLSELECQVFLALAKPQVFARGVHLYMQGDPLRRLFLILRGCVTLSRANAEGEEAIVWLAGKGDALGWSDRISSHVHPCSARIATTCGTLTWELSSIDDLVSESDRLQCNLKLMLFHRLGDLQERFCALATAGAESRLALSVIRLAAKVGIREPDGVRVPLTREEIARMSGTCMFTASRIVSRWAAAGLIRPIRRGIVVPNGSKLQAFVECSDSGGMTELMQGEVRDESRAHAFRSPRGNGSTWTQW